VKGRTVRHQPFCSSPQACPFLLLLPLPYSSVKCVNALQHKNKSCRNEQVWTCSGWQFGLDTHIIAIWPRLIGHCLKIWTTRREITWRRSGRGGRPSRR
jgi:hypothetical protein